MKYFKLSLLILILSLPFAGCEKTEDVVSTDTEVGHSKIVYFPSIEINGEHLITVLQGGAFTDPGATALLNGQPAQYTVQGSVNTAVPGVYELSYEAKNPQGFSATDFRTVVVIGNDVSGNDFSGTYLRGATGITSTWTKTSQGVYTVENPGGAGVGVGLTVVAVNYTGNEITIPRQISPDLGEVSSESESYTPGPPAVIKYILHAGGYGTSLRTFVKQ